MNDRRLSLSHRICRELISIKAQRAAEGRPHFRSPKRLLTGNALTTVYGFHLDPATRKTCLLGVHFRVRRHSFGDPATLFGSSPSGAARFFGEKHIFP